jgi:hypothetical protein
MKTGPGALDTAQKESGSAKHETEPDAVVTVKNKFGSAKYEN